MKVLNVKPSKQMAFMVIIFIFIIVCMALIFTFKQTEILQQTENFSIETLPFTEYNTFKKQISCPRKLAFINFISSIYNASERSIDAGIKTNGQCPVNMKDPVLGDELSHVEENRVRYALKSFCIQLKYTKIDLQENTGSNNVLIHITNEPSALDNMMNILYLYLSNPIYIEFEGSEPYIPDYDDRNNLKNPAFLTTSFYTNYNNGKLLKNSSGDEIVCLFKRLIKASVKNNKISQGKSSNVVFDYTNKSKELKDIIKDKKGGTINAKIYFLEPLVFAGMELRLSHLYSSENEIGIINIYNKNFQADIVDKNTDEYFFHQKMYVLLQNSDLPSLTFKFDLCIPTSNYKNFVDKYIEVFKAYMDVDVGKFKHCKLDNLNFIPIGSQNFNIFSASIMANGNMPETFKMFIATTSNANKQDCNANPGGILELELPFSPYNERISVTLTVSPYEKICLCKWKSGGNEYFVFKRSPVCNIDNNFYKLYNQRNETGNVQGNDINLVYNSPYITDISSVSLGHKNYLKDYFSRI